MNVPGSNLLAMALRVITPQEVKLFRFTERSTNAIGMQVSTFAAGVPVWGSVQPINRSLYQQYGLNFAKDYLTFYATKLIQGVDRLRAGDQIEWDGRRWQVESANDWHSVDGWNGVLCISL